MTLSVDQDSQYASFPKAGEKVDSRDSIGDVFHDKEHTCVTCKCCGEALRTYHHGLPSCQSSMRLPCVTTHRLFWDASHLYFLKYGYSGHTYWALGVEDPALYRNCGMFLRNLDETCPRARQKVNQIKIITLMKISTYNISSRAEIHI